MEISDFDNIKFDYYTNTSSYVKLIMDMLPESKVSAEKKHIIRELYNYFLNNSNGDKILEISTISSLFREKIAISDIESIAKHVEYIYSTFLDKIIFDSTNRKKIFDIMNESMKVYVGYYSMNTVDTLESVQEDYNYAR